MESSQRRPTCAISSAILSFLGAGCQHATGACVVKDFDSCWDGAKADQCSDSSDSFKSGQTCEALGYTVSCNDGGTAVYGSQDDCSTGAS